MTASNQAPKNKDKNNSKIGFWRSDRAILMVCIGIASLLWFFTKLSDVYRSSLTVGLEFKIPTDKVLSVAPPKSIELEVEASGWELLRLYFQAKKYVLDVDLSDNTPKTLNALAIKSKLARQLPEEVAILELRPDVIQLNPEALSTKSIPIVLNNKLEFDGQYQLKDTIRLSPSMVEIKGPASVINNIQYWTTESFEINSLKSDFSKNVAVKKHPNANVVFVPTEITASGSVEEVTEKKLEVEIEKRGVPDSLLLVLLPQRITISCIVGLSAYDYLNADEFSAVVDFSKIDLYNQNNIKIELQKMPDYVRQVQYHPKKVDYIIRR